MRHCAFTTFSTFSFLTFHRATVKKGVTFRTATPSNSLLWDITLDMGADGAIAVICQRKAPIPGKRQVCLLCRLSLCGYFLLSGEVMIYSQYYVVENEQIIPQSLRVGFSIFCCVSNC